MTLYLTVKKLLKDFPDLRNSDAKLRWAVWREQGLARDSITYLNFLKAADCESIRRCRQKIQKECPELGAAVETKRMRVAKQFTVPYRDMTPVFNYSENTVRFE